MPSAIHIPNMLDILGWYNVKDYGAKGDMRELSDVGITSGSPIFTTTGGSLTQADVGKIIHIVDNSVGGINRVRGTILSVQSGTQGTASVNAAATLSNRFAQIATDDTVAVQAAVDAPGGPGGVCFFPPGKYKFSTTITSRILTQFIGCGSGYQGDAITSRITVLDFSYISNLAALLGPSNCRGFRVENLFLQGPMGTAVSGSEGINPGNIAFNARIRNVFVRGFYKGISLNFDQNTVIEDSWCDGSQFACLYATGGSNLKSDGVLYSNANLTSADVANVVIDGGYQGVKISAPVMDEGPASSTGGTLNIKNGLDVTIDIPLLYLSKNGLAVNIGASSRRVKINNMKIAPFSGDRVPIQTINIVSGAQDVHLTNVITDANGGGDISDAGTRTVYINVNGQSSGVKDTVTTKSADFTLTALDSEKVFLLTAADKICTLPATVAGLRFTFVISAAALSAGTGFSISPNASDKIMANGITSADNKDLINTGATDAEGDTVTIEGDGVDGWYVTVMRGTWAREA
jgi:hypothetical protein